MLIFPAIDLLDKKCVRLFKGDYNQVTVYSENPVEIAKDFENCGAEYIHMVDLDGAKNGTTTNFDVIKAICDNTDLFVEIGGGIRNMDTIDRYLSIGVKRVILGTAAIKDQDFLVKALNKYPNNVAVGADVKDGYIAISGWCEKSTVTLDDFFEKMVGIGVKNIICTDISKDGAMIGTNREMYRELSLKYKVDITASGGVSTLEDIQALKDMNLYGAIVGKAYYTKAIDLRKAIEVAI